MLILTLPLEATIPQEWEQCHLARQKKFFRGRMFAHKETRKTWSSKGDAMASKVIDYYSFDVKSIRNPIENLVNESGWRLVQVLSRSEASYKKKGWFHF